MCTDSLGISKTCLPVILKISHHPLVPVFYFFPHVKLVTLNFLLSFPCGPPFMLVTEPRLLTKGFNLIWVCDLAQSANCDRSQGGESSSDRKEMLQRLKLNDPT